MSDLGRVDAHTLADVRRMTAPKAIQPRRNIWSRAAELAAETPESRNRYVDFLRAVSIGAVVIGHWLVAAPHLNGGEINLDNMLYHQPWTQLLTWAFQVMPVFFIVGGYSNGVSWRSAQRSSHRYAEWLSGRLQRLVGPVLPLLFVWALVGAVAHWWGVDPRLIRLGSQMALIPIWFLAVYVGAVVLVPVTHAAWQRWGIWSFVTLAIAAALDDTLFFAANMRAVGWLNYPLVWLAVHQLGYAWRDGKLAGLRKVLPLSLGALLILVGLVILGPYPLSMVSVPGETVSNSLPPKFTLLVLGVFQGGLLLSLQAPVGRWLTRMTPWTVTVLVNGMIMTIYLWHLTAMTLLAGLGLATGFAGLTLVPGSAVWWLYRPAWIAILLVALALFGLMFGRLERSAAGFGGIGAWRLIVGSALVCGGLALVALDGVGGNGLLGIRVWVIALPFAGAALAGVNPMRSRPG